MQHPTDQQPVYQSPYCCIMVRCSAVSMCVWRVNTIHRVTTLQCEIPWHFPGGLWHCSAALGMLSVTHIMPVLVLNTCMDVNMQRTNSLRNFSITRFFPWLLVKSLTFPCQLSNSLTFPGCPYKWSPRIHQQTADRSPTDGHKVKRVNWHPTFSSGGKGIFWPQQFLHAQIKFYCSVC